MFGRSTKLPSVKNVKDPKISKLFEIPTQSIAMNQHCIYFSPFLSSLSFLGLLHISLSSKTYFSFPQTFFPHFIIQYYFSNSSFLDRYIHRRNFSQTYMYISLRKFHRNFPLSDHAVNRLTWRERSSKTNVSQQRNLPRQMLSNCIIIRLSSVTSRFVLPVRGMEALSPKT